MRKSPAADFVSFNVQNRPLDEYLLTEFKTFTNPFSMFLYFKT